MASQSPLPVTGASTSLAGKVAYVVVCGIGFGPDLVVGLEAQGAHVALLCDSIAPTSARQIATDFGSRSSLEAAFAKAAAQVGNADLVVHAAAPAVLLKPASVADMSEANFGVADVALRATLYTFQAAHGQMASRGGAIVVVGPALSLVGAKQFVPLLTASEGQRSMVKTTARQWGHLGITLNWVAAANEQFDPSLAGKGPTVPELGPPPCPLGRAPDMATGIAPILAFIGSSAGRSMTGVSINLDGGDWMTP